MRTGSQQTLMQNQLCPSSRKSVTHAVEIWSNKRPAIFSAAMPPPLALMFSVQQPDWSRTSSQSEQRSPSMTRRADEQPETLSGILALSPTHNLTHRGDHEPHGTRCLLACFHSTRRGWGWRGVSFSKYLLNQDIKTSISGPSRLLTSRTVPGGNMRKSDSWDSLTAHRADVYLH